MFKKADANAPPPGDGISVGVFSLRLADSGDAVFGEITVNHMKLAVIFIDGLIDFATVNDYILKPLTQEPALRAAKNERELTELVMSGAVYHGQRKLRETMTDCMAD
jgi:hypothetical protein